MSWRQIVGLTCLSGSLVLAHTRDAQACGGCFHPPTPSTSPMTTVVTAHRMAFALSTARTVLWDQIQYAGSPAEFSWVLPVRGDATLEAAEDAWFESLEAVTSTQVSPPQLNCFTRTGSQNSGCSCVGVGGAASDDSFAGNAGTSGGTTVPPDVTVQHQGTVGPYQFVQLTATSSMSLEQWLADNGYVVPTDVQPVVAAYVREGFGFIALKLRPQASIREMTPVRVITPGASPTLPLRMVAAGTGSTVGITLYVIAEGRYEPEVFPTASVDFTKLTWDWSMTPGLSNYSELRRAALASGDGTGWLTSYAVHQAFNQTYSDALGQQLRFTPTVTSSGNGGFGNTVAPAGVTTLAELYFAQSAANAGKTNLCPKIAELLTSASQVIDTCRPDPSSDADAGAGATLDAAAAGVDAAAGDAASAMPPKLPVVCDPAPPGRIASHDFECGGFSDIASAMIGMHPSDVWVTRLEANLPHAALNTDLRLHPAAAQTAVPQVHRAVTHVNPPCDLLENHPEVALLPRRSSGPTRKEQAGLGFLSAFGALAMRRLARKTKDRRASRER